MKPITALTVAAFALAACATAHAQTSWPAKPARIVVPQAAGNATDIIARLTTEKLTQNTGQQFVIENRPGAANMIGATSVARSAPDGYTFLFGTAAVFTTNLYTMKNLTYDPVKDFEMVALIARGVFMVVANPSLPANNLPEVIALAKKQPGKLNIATDQPRNFTGIIAQWINKSTGANITPVPYINMPQGVQDVINNRVEMSILALPAAGPQLEAGKLKPIAVSSAQPIPGYEKVRPIADVIPGFDFFGWFNFSAPAGTPKDIIAKFNVETGKVLDDPAYQKRIAEMGFYSFGSHPVSKADEFLQKELVAWKKVVDTLGIEPQ